jgi:hypothetical protein
MTSRTGWLIGAAALSLGSLSGCFWQNTRNDSVRKDIIAPVEVAWPEDKSPWQPGNVEWHPPRMVPEPTLSESQKAPSEPPKADPKVDVVAPSDRVANPPPAVAEARPGPAKLAPLVEALKCILDERPEEALRHLQAYDRDTQEFYLRALPTLTILARKRVEELSGAEVAALTDQLQNLLATLRPHAELAIDRMCFCEWVKAYGYYQPLPDSHAYRPGEIVQLYVEVRNFACVPRDGSFETRLASNIEIRDSQGQTVKNISFKEREKAQRSWTRLNDYCNAYTFLVPPLPPGAYQLVLQIADETNPETRRVAQKSLEFRVTTVGTRPN